MKSVLLSLSFGLLLTTACGKEQEPTRSDTDPSTDEETDSPDGEDPELDAGRPKDAGRDSGRKDTGVSKPPVKVDPPEGSDGDTCESKTVPTRGVPPEILIVLDKSLSMAATRWVPSASAVVKFTNTYQGLVAFGLEVFPAGFSCEPGTVVVEPALNNGPVIEMTIGTTIPVGITPTASSLRNALTFLGDRQPAGDVKATPAYVVLVTDGEPTCPDEVSPDPIQGSIDAAKALNDAGIKTFVIGYDVTGPGADVMNQIAAAGGTDTFYPVENEASLNEAFDKITKDVVRCEFELGETPPDPTFVKVTIDGEQVNLNSDDGWVIEGRKVTLQGGSCEKLKDGETHRLDANVLCEPVTLL
jgi:hypothetical protein